MKKEILKLIMEDVLQTAKEILVKEGKVLPIALVIRDGNIDRIPLSFRDENEKISQISMLKDFVKNKNADIAIVVTESWYVETDSGHLTMSPSKDPRKKECIMIIGECEECGVALIQLFGKEEDKENGKIVFGKKIDDLGNFSSKFNFGIKDRKKKT
jgi:hypothetical protein